MGVKVNPISPEVKTHILKGLFGTTEVSPSRRSQFFVATAPWQK